MTAARRLAGRSRARLRTLREEAMVRVGGSLGRLGRRVVLRVHAGEDVPVPPPLVSGGRSFDVRDDLAAYTGLPLDEVDELLRRRTDSFRAEWYLTPPGIRRDAWFYRSSLTYLFGNAVHVHEQPELLATILRHTGSSGRALDFGGGTGNLALGLAAGGLDVDYLERSALQKDFVAFRVHRHGLGDQVRVLDDWELLPREAYDAVCALDVLEHLEHLDESLRGNLLPSIRPGGLLIESSPFVRNVSNPMHHEHGQLDELLADAGFVLEADDPMCRVWRRLPPDHADQVAAAGAADTGVTGG
ncbi:MAG TPA: class I SAM-dependent methyltransferase [Gaiellaceae bacterium]